MAETGKQVPKIGPQFGAKTLDTTPRMHYITCVVKGTHHTHGGNMSEMFKEYQEQVEAHKGQMFAEVNEVDEVDVAYIKVAAAEEVLRKIGRPGWHAIREIERHVNDLMITVYESSSDAVKAQARFRAVAAAEKVEAFMRALGDVTALQSRVRM